MPRIAQQPAYVLHARAYRESSLLVEALSRDHGRVAMVARGARRGRSKLRNTLQPFRPLLLSWSGRGELGTLTGGEQVAAPPGLAGEVLYCGLYLNELLVRFLHRGDPHPEVFAAYRESVGLLAGGGDPEPALRVFEKQLLDAVGYGLTLDHEHGSGEAIRDERFYHYRPGQGAVRASEDAARNGKAFSGRALLALKSERIEPADLPDLRRLMRAVIGYHAGDRPLISQALMLGLRRQQRGAGAGRREETGNQNHE